MKKKLFLLTTLLLSLGITSCGGSSNESLIPNDPYDDGSVKTPYNDYDNGKRITKVILDKENVLIDITKEESFKINATYEPSDAYNSYLFYESSNEDVAVVDEIGQVLCKSNGEANISVTSDTGVGTTCHVTVYTPITGLNITPHSELETGYVMDISETRQFSVSYVPSSTNETDVIWSVLDNEGKPSQLATISDTGLLNVAAPKGTKNTILNVVATSKYNKDVFATEKVTINDNKIYATGVKIYENEDDISETSKDLYLDSVLTLNAKTTPEITTGGDIIWSVDDSTICSVINGVVTPLKAPATTKVRVSVDGVSNYVTINTLKVAVTSVTVSESSLALRKGETAQLSATVLPTNASVKDVSYDVFEGNEFVSVDENSGLVTALKTGTGKIKVSSKDDTTKFDVCEVSVTNTIQSIAINKPVDDIYYGGKTYELTLTSTPISCDPYNVTWSIDDDTLATISTKGVLTTNNSNLTGKVNVTVTVDGTSIENSIELDIKKPIGPFVSDNQYLVGNRDFTKTTKEYTHPSWDDSDYAKVLEEVSTGGDTRFEKQWALKGITLYHKDSSNPGDEFKIRSDVYPESCGLNDGANNKVSFIEGTSNFTVSKDDQYDLYYQKNTAAQKVACGNDYWIYAESVFSDGYYFVGNRNYSTGTSSGTPGEDTSWINKENAKKLDKDTSAENEQYVATLTLEANDEFRIRNAEWITSGMGGGASSKFSAKGDNFVVNEAGTYIFYFVPSYGNDMVYVEKKLDPPEPGVKYTITLNLPDGTDNTYKNFVSSQIEVDSGTVVSTALADKKSSINGFSFEKWSSDKTFADNLGDTQVFSNMTIYGKFKKDNVLYFYDGTYHNYFTDTPGYDVAVDDQYHKYMVGTQTFGVDAVVGTDYDLTSKSGIYNFYTMHVTGGIKWECKRKITISIANVATDWKKDGAEFYLYMWNDTASAEHEIELESDNTATMYVYAYYTGFVIYRKDPVGHSIWNQTVDITVNNKDAGTATYGKDHITCYVENNKDGSGKYHYSWW